MERTIRLGSNRGKPRLWLEGAWLVELGFVRGARFTATLTDGTLTLQLGSPTLGNCGECLWNTQDITPLDARGVCPKCKANYGTAKVRTVSGKDKANGTPHPIIDMNGAELAPLAGMPLTLTAKPGLLTIRTS